MKCGFILSLLANLAGAVAGLWLLWCSYFPADHPFLQPYLPALKSNLLLTRMLFLALAVFAVSNIVDLVKDFRAGKR